MPILDRFLKPKQQAKQSNNEPLPSMDDMGPVFEMGPYTNPDNPAELYSIPGGSWRRRLLGIEDLAVRPKESYTHEFRLGGESINRRPPK